MRIKQGLVVVGLAGACGAGVAIAAHPRVNPATVPTGFLMSHNRVSDIPVSSVNRVIKSGKADVFIEHVRLLPGQSSGFHTHPGPVVVTVAAGSLTYEAGSRGRCVRRRVVVDRGFVERGIHRVTAGAAGADYYAVYLVPRLTGPTQRGAARPRACAR
jgi:hypothetical protein